jgi:23S rRNA (uracil1939-C5)-methyltransferase
MISGPMADARGSAPVRLETTAMATDGRAVARLESGKVVFVEGALPGEVVLAAMSGERSSFAEARVASVLEPSPDRIAEPCPRARQGCGGCQWQHVAPAAQRRLKTTMITESLRRIGHLEDTPLRETVELPPWRWRTSIRAGVSDGRAGLRRGASHDLIDAEGCLVAHPLLLPLLSGRRYGGADSVLLRCGARTGEVLAAVTPSGATCDLPRRTNRRWFHEEAAGRRWRVSAGSFFQGRPDGADALAALVLGAAGPGDGRAAVDAYSGVGLFAGVLAATGWRVTAVEAARRSVADARTNLSGDEAEVIRADVARWVPSPADLVVADPSRAGLGTGGATTVAGTGAARIVLISCDVASLARDARLLVDRGYQLRSVTPVDMFPHTWHVEVVTVLEKVA